MPLSYEISADDHLAQVEGRGAADFDAFIGVMNAVIADPSFSPDFDIVADFSQLDYVPSFRDIKKLAGEFEKVRAALPSRVGIVVKNKVQLRLGRFAAMVAGLLKFDLSVFEDRADANRWLGRRRTARLDDVKARIMELWSEPQLSALATVTTEGKPWVRYVLTMASPDLVFRFATYEGSRKTAQIVSDPEVHLVAGARTMESAERWAQVSGRAQISEAEEDRRLAWHDTLAPFFAGLHDPNWVAAVVRPYRIEYMEMGFGRPELWQLAD